VVALAWSCGGDGTEKMWIFKGMLVKQNPKDVRAREEKMVRKTHGEERNIKLGIKMESHPHPADRLDEET
jgi:hypothetical protein